MRLSSVFLSFCAVIGSIGPAVAQDIPLVPERRLSIAEGMDLAGRDLRQIFDTSLEACEAACLSDSACEAVTFNARSNSCFPKAGVTAMTPYQGAFSGVVVVANKGAEARARTRAADLDFLAEGSLTEATALAAVVESYQTTLLLGTPTFLGGICRCARSEQLRSLRLAVTGAERCPHSVYQALAAAAPSATIIRSQSTPGEVSTLSGPTRCCS